jgi:hypothetical protein
VEEKGGRADSHVPATEDEDGVRPQAQNANHDAGAKFHRTDIEKVETLSVAGYAPMIGQSDSSHSILVGAESAQFMAWNCVITCDG